MNKTRHYIRILLLLLFLFAGGANTTWAYNVTYHVLTLPMNSTRPGNTKSDYYNWRTEAIKVVVNNATTIELPAHFKSPLATNFKYYTVDGVTKYGEPTATAQAIYQNHSTKFFLYQINGEPGNGKSAATPKTEGSAITSNCDIYVTYEYDEDNTIAKLDGSVPYNIIIRGGFLSFNKGRNNRLAVIPKKYNNDYIIAGEELCSNNFSKINLSGKGTGITTWWNNNLTPRATADSYFHFLFKYEGCDPYNITIRTAYDGNDYYIEQWGSSENKPMNKYYRESSVFYESAKKDNILIASDDNRKYTTANPNKTEIDVDYDDMPGYYRNIAGAIWNSFALLNNTTNDGYVYMGTKCVNNDGSISDPTDNQYYYLKADNNTLTYSLMTPANASASYSADKKMYQLEDYTFYVTTPFGNTVSDTKRWTEAYDDMELQASHVPASLRRKYCSIMGFYKDAALTQAITTFGEAENKKIYVKYQVTGAPFTAIAPGDSYTTATWYELTDAESTQLSGKKLRLVKSGEDDYVSSGVFKNNGKNEVYEKESEFAFIGDPYELRIINRQLTTKDSRNYYVGSSSQTSGTDLTCFDSNSGTETAGFKWDIPYDDTSGSFTLREFGSTNAYWNWTTASSGNKIQYSTSASTHVKVMELPKFTYTYHIVDLAGNIAVKASIEQTIFSTLSLASIPEIIRSPFLAEETLTFYSTYSGGGRGNLSGSLTETPGSNANIYVKYTTSALSSKPFTLSENQEINVKLNGQYIYWDNGVIKSKENPSDPELESSAYLWHLRGRDPYAMLIDNRGATVAEGLATETEYGVTYTTENITTYSDDGVATNNVTRNRGMFVQAASSNGAELSFTETRASASRFIAKLGTQAGVYEVMATTGSSVDASSTYYNIGRSAANTVKMYSNKTSEGGYLHGNAVLQFNLETSNTYYYHLIDKSKKLLLTVKSRSPELIFPAEYQSPLVSKYYYYDLESFNVDNGVYTLKGGASEISSPQAYIYVTYDVGDFGFGTTHPHLLKFYNGSSYYLEDGSDKLTSSKIQAIYPYCNGDGNLNVYGQKMRDEQMNGGSNTRSRWIWFFETDENNPDPYHVKIHSKNTISFNGTHTTYFQTYAVHFNQDADANTKHVVTGANFPGISGEKATEYMVLGTTGNYKLLTTNTINDGTTNVRRYVTSFEQYWKTYNMIKQHVLGIDKDNDENYKDKFSEERETFVIPDELRDDLVTKLTTLHINDSEDLNYVAGSSWHSYDAIANAVRWNGYNDKSTGHNTKKVERLEHWYQTFNMGDGTFDIEDANIPPVLVLLDRHGWEIMRKPIPTGNSDPDREEKLAALRAFNSPMVKEYKFYSNAQKASDCHKFTLRIQDDKERDTIAVNGKRFTSTSLGTLPPYKADQDLYVTYTVKEEYEKSYKYSLTYTTEKDENNKIIKYNITESGTPSAFIVLQNHQYAWDNSSTLTGTTAPSPLSSEIIEDAGKAENLKTFQEKALWYLQPNLDIDDEMGCPWAGTIGNSNEPYTKNESKVKYKDKTGFDPYNLQLKNVATDKFFTTDMTDSELSGGVYTGIYSDGGSSNVTLAAQSAGFVATEESYDHSHLKITNQTFMAVQDENGNMQLMPRFDHSHRINAFTTLADPLTHATKADIDDASPGAQTTFLVRPVVYDYRILDNDGNVALRYKTGGEFYPSMPEHFKSPLAKDFRFYYGQAVYKAPVASTVENRTAADPAYQKTATDSVNMITQVKALIVSGDYYFEIGSSAPYSYKKVTVVSGNTTSSSDGIYADVKDKKDISDREITSSFAAADIQESADIFIRYSYDEANDIEHDNVLQGRWMTMSLAGENAQYSGDLNASGSGIFKDADTPTKPGTIDSSNAARKWQWKFLQSPCIPTSEYYIAPDPYAVRISNREANNDNPTANPNKMSIGIKVGSTDRFVILSHPSGDYAFAAAGDGLSYSFLNGASMTAPTTTPASIVAEGGFTTTANTITDGARVIFTDEVTYTYTYNIITNGKLLAASATQDMEDVQANNFRPVVPKSIQSGLLNMDEYLYYGTAIYTDKGTTGISSDDEYAIDNPSQIDNLYGLYEDVIYVHYVFDRDKTPYLVPNSRNAKESETVAIDEATSNPVAIDISGKLPHNIIWLNNNIMQSDGSTISDGEKHDLDGDDKYIWYFCNNDPYALQIRHKSNGDYIDGDDSLGGSPKSYMLLKMDGYDFGVFAETGNQTNMLTFSGTISTTTSNPQKFIPFALSVHHLIYHLVINTTNVNTEIPYRVGDENSWEEAGWKDYAAASPNTKNIKGTTQRDLTSIKDEGAANQAAGDKYQLGETLSLGGEYVTYCHDAGKVSIGDSLEVPSCFYRPNCLFIYYVEGVYDDLKCEEPNNDLNNKYKGLEVKKLMSDAALIGKTVRVNIAYGFNTGLETNVGDGFVTNVDQNLWYTFETAGSTPYLAHYTNAWGLQAMEGRDTRYTNDYLWTPLGDVYGFKMYNRYVYKTSHEMTRVMTTESFAEGKTLKMAVPGSTITNEESASVIATAGNEVYELLETPDQDGYFYIHPVINDTGTKYYIRRNTTPGDKLNFAILSTTPSKWTFGLTEDLVKPYYDRAGYVGGLTSAGKTAYEAASDLMAKQKVVYNDEYIVPYSPGFYRLHNQPDVSGLKTPRYASGYLHKTELTARTETFQKTAIDADDVKSQSNLLTQIGNYYFKVGSSNPYNYYKVTVTVPYNGSTNATHNASTIVASSDNSSESEWNVAGAIPMHFYSKVNTSTTFRGEGGLTSGFTESVATRGVIPVPQTEYDPSTIFYFDGAALTPAQIDAGTLPTSKISTQGLYVKGDETDDNHGDAKMTDTAGDATTFTIMDIGGAVFLIHDGSGAPTRKYFHFSQSYTVGEDNKIYDLKYFHNSPTDDAKWCLEPAKNQGLMVTTNDGGDGYFYATFCAPFDVALPEDDGSNSYYAYVCNEWDTEIIHPKKVPAKTIDTKTYNAGEFVPAGTPVIIRTTDNSKKIKLTLPTNTPTTPAVSCVFTGKYLEQLLADKVTASDQVYTFGLPIRGYTGVTYTLGDDNGNITEVVGGVKDDKGVGFFINATPNKELSGIETGQWAPNNRYVLHNKIYYRSDGSGASARRRTPMPTFIPVVFDDELAEEVGDEEQVPFDGRVYDMQGRCVAHRQTADDNSWKQLVAPGIYIVNGKKMLVGRR